MVEEIPYKENNHYFHSVIILVFQNKEPGCTAYNPCFEYHWNENSLASFFYSNNEVHLKLCRQYD
jgi:hypothetical protein